LGKLHEDNQGLTLSMNDEKRADRTIFARLKAANPQPNTELEYTSVFELLAAVLLSAQATDVGVNKATRRLFAVANTPQAILNLGCLCIRVLYSNHWLVSQQSQALDANL
jgi:endonuclease III